MLRPIAQLIVGLAALALVSWGGYRLFAYLKGNVSKLQHETATVLLVVSVALVLGALVISGGFRGGARLTARARMKEDRGRMYEELVSLGLRQVRAPMNPTEFTTSVAMIEPRFLLSAPRGVLSRYGDFKRACGDDDEIEPSLLELILAMRSDIGEGFANERAEIERLIASESRGSNIADAGAT